MRNPAKSESTNVSSYSARKKNPDKCFVSQQIINLRRSCRSNATTDESSHLAARYDTSTETTQGAKGWEL